MIAADITELELGVVVGERYRITRVIGRGGMGTVYEAEHVKLPRSVALKVLLPEYAKMEKAIRRFEREARAASSIDHRNVIQIEDFGHLPSGELYYTMELLLGRDLSEILREDGPIPWSRAGWIILQIVRALGAIHAQEIVHRDIKPANCFLMDPKPGDEADYVKILDFGIANLQDDRTMSTAVTGTSEVIGSACYMAPEQILADRVDARTDVYALGVMIYQLLTGQVPFDGPSAVAVMMAHQRKTPRPPRQLTPDIPAEVEASILRALAKEPDDRFQSMAELEAVLLPLVELPRAVGASTPYVTSRSSVTLASRGPRWMMTVVACAILPVAAVGTLRLFEDRHKGTDAPPIILTGDRVDPPPEQPYNPFTDPFGAPTLSGRTMIWPSPSSTTNTESRASGIPNKETPLEEILPPESWLLERGSIAGQVRSNEMQPLSEAGVCAWIIDPRAPEQLRKQPICTRTDHSGRFELAGVIPSLHDVHVFKDHFLPQGYEDLHSYPVVLEPGGTTDGLEFNLEPGGAKLRGTVHNEAREPIPGVMVAVVGGPRVLDIVDESGSFELWVGQQDVSVVAWATGYADLVVKARAEDLLAEEPLALVLHAEAKLVGRVVDKETREPIVGARVRAGYQGDLDVNPLAYTNRHGEFTFSGLSAGEYQPEARTDDAYGQLSLPHELSEGIVSPELTIRTHRLTGEPPEPELRTETTSTGPIDTDGDGSSTSGDMGIASSGTEGDTDDTAGTGGETSIEPKIDRNFRRRSALRRKLRQCGKGGAIVVNAKFVLSSGKLSHARVEVTGPAATDPSIKQCAEDHVKTFEMPPRKEVTRFKRLKARI